MKKPKILFFDIETVPAIFAGYRLGKQRVSHDQVLKRPQIMCISWAWNNSKVKNAAFDLDMYDWYEKDDNADYELVKRFEELARDAEMVVAHNGKKFDVAVLKSRIVKYRLPPLTPFLIDDTYQLTKDIGFFSHKLDDLGDYLGFGGKMEHGKGMEWWMDVMRGDHHTLTKMMKYCNIDVSRLRSIYNELKPYVKSTLNMSAFTGEPIACRSCGKLDLEKRGFARTTVGKRQRYQCKNCGAWTTNGRNLLKKSSHYNR